MSAKMKNINVISYNFTGRSLVLVYRDSKGITSKQISDSNVNWPLLKRAYQAKNWNKVIELIDIPASIERGSRGKFVVKNGAVYQGDKPVVGYIYDRIMDCVRGSMPYKNLLAFAQNLDENPSEQSRKDLYRFLEGRNFTIDDKGLVVGWKGISRSGYSVHGNKNVKVLKGKVNDKGQIRNEVGDVIEIERNSVDANTGNDCSVGLHISNRGFATNFCNERLMVVRFHPRDCVCVPHSDAQKLRVAKYEIIGEEFPDSNNNNDAYVKPKKGPKRDSNGRFAKKR